MLLAGIAGLALAALTGLAVAKSFTLGVAKNVSVSSKREAIVVNSHGISVYDLVPETTRHPLCTKANGCFKFWFPVKVASAKTKPTKAPGIGGKLGVWHRDGFFQVTLAGHPLYTFKFDNNKRGSATGEGIKNFKGTWHVIRASSSTKAGSTTTSPPMTSTGYTFPPGY
jgi:predicted lipoprotein with Yx(FWY)xxD motif